MEVTDVAKDNTLIVFISSYAENRDDIDDTLSNGLISVQGISSASVNTVEEGGHKAKFVTLTLYRECDDRMKKGINAVLAEIGTIGHLITGDILRNFAINNFTAKTEGENNMVKHEGERSVTSITATSIKKGDSSILEFKRKTKPSRQALRREKREASKKKKNKAADNNHEVTKSEETKEAARIPTSDDSKVEEMISLWLRSTEESRKAYSKSEDGMLKNKDGIESIINIPVKVTPVEKLNHINREKANESAETSTGLGNEIREMNGETVKLNDMIKSGKIDPSSSNTRSSSHSCSGVELEGDKKNENYDCGAENNSDRTVNSNHRLDNKTTTSSDDDIEDDQEEEDDGYLDSICEDPSAKAVAMSFFSRTAQTLGFAKAIGLHQRYAGTVCPANADKNRKMKEEERDVF